MPNCILGSRDVKMNRRRKGPTLMELALGGGSDNNT